MRPDPTRGVVDRIVQRDVAESSRRFDREPFAGSDREGMPVDLGRAERGAILGVVPRRSLWPELAQFDERVGKLQIRQGETQTRVQELRTERANAPQADAAALASWELAGRNGARPEPRAERLDREIADLERERDGLQLAAEQVMERKATFVVTNRKRLVRVADRACAEAHAKVLRLVDELQAAREALAELRQTAVWASLYPHETAAAAPQASLFAGGLAQPALDAFGASQRVEIGRLLAGLRADADWAARAATPEQHAVMTGSPRQNGAVWADSDEGREAERADKKAALARYKALWGREPA